MSPELQDALVRDFPRMFRDVKAGLHASCMYFGCECGDGWEPLIREFCEEFKDDPNVYFTQIKEKYGRLCLYHVGSDSSFDKERELWERSASICEDCGKPADTEREQRGWIYTLCKDCFEELYKIRS